MAMQVWGLDILHSRLLSAATRFGDWSDEFRASAVIAAESIRVNFAMQGRPDKWKPSRRVEREGGLTLVDTGALIETVDADNFVASGTFLSTEMVLVPDPRVPYGLRLHEGDEAVGLEARPWFMLQEQDVVQIHGVFMDGVRRRLGPFGGLV